MPSRVYVIELAREAGRRRDPRIPWVYVGSSARDPESRFQQHRSGYRSARLVKRFALRLRPDLYEDLEAFRGSRLARQAELRRARELADCGFVAHCDGTSYGRDVADWSEWDAERLGPVLSHLDAAALDLADSAFTVLRPEQGARLLHGEYGFWIRDYIDQEDPPPAYGLFPHVRLDVIEDRLAKIWPDLETARDIIGAGGEHRESRTGT
ncbi:MAG TPA: hypothetical protein VI035_07665 [Solirubrobacterales bacterium]